MRKLLVIIVALTFLVGCGSEKASDAEVYTYAKQEISKQCIINGTVVPKDDNNSVITSLTQCKVTQIYVENGDSLKKGDAICKFDVSEIESQIKELEKESGEVDKKSSADLDFYETALTYVKDLKTSDLQAKQSEIDTQQVLYDQTVEKYNQAVFDYDAWLQKSNELKNNLDNAQNVEGIENYSNQYSESLTKINEFNQLVEQYSQEQTEISNGINTLKNDYTIAEKEHDYNISVAQHDLNSYKLGESDDDSSTLKKLKEQVEQSTLYASDDGVVTNLNISVGQICEDGKVLEISLVDEKLQVKVSVFDEYILFIEEGMEVEFSSSSMNDIVYQGVVSKVNLIKGEEGFDVYVDVENPQELISGMTASITFTLESTVSYAVPTTAITKDDEGKNVVYTLDKDGEDGYIVKTNLVSVGMADSSYIEITQGNISDKDLVIIDPSLYYEGQKVLPVDSQK